MTPSKREGQQEGSETASRAEGKNHLPQGPLGSPPFTVFNPDSPKWGRAGVEEGCYQDGWGNKVRVQAGGGPEVSHTSSRLTGSRITHREGGRPPQLEGFQHREEAARKLQELGKEGEGLRAKRRPAALLRTKFQLHQAIRALQIEDHKIEALLKKNLHRQEGQDRPRRTISKTRSLKEGSGTSSRAESKSRMPPRLIGSPPFMALDPGSPKWGKAEAGDGCYQDGGGNKARTPAGGGPEVSCAPLRLPDSKANYFEGGPPPQEPSTRRRSSGEQQDKLARERSLIQQLETNLQHREEALRQKQAGARKGPESGASGDWEF